MFPNAASPKPVQVEQKLTVQGRVKETFRTTSCSPLTLPVSKLKPRVIAGGAMTTPSSRLQRAGSSQCEFGKHELRVTLMKACVLSLVMIMHAAYAGGGGVH